MVHGGGTKGEGVGDGADLGESALGEDAVEKRMSAADQEVRDERRRRGRCSRANGGATHMRRQVFPQAPSPTITSLRRISAIWTSQRGYL